MPGQSATISKTSAGKIGQQSDSTTTKTHNAPASKRTSSEAALEEKAARTQAPTSVQPVEPEDAYLTGVSRSLQRRLLGLMWGALEPRPNQSPELLWREFIRPALMPRPRVSSRNIHQKPPRAPKRNRPRDCSARSIKRRSAQSSFSWDPGSRPGIQSSAFKSRVANSIGGSSAISIWPTPIAPMFLASEKTLPRPSTEPTRLL